MNDEINVIDEAQYSQIKVPDYKALSELLMLARGTDRSMEEFAVECGVSPATFSRIKNCRITRPLNIEMIKMIAEHADYYSKENIFERIVSANGMVRGDATEADVKQVVEKIAELIEKRKREQNLTAGDMKNLLTSSLLNAGFAIRSLKYNELPPVCWYSPVDADWACYELVGHEPRYCMAYMFPSLKYDPSTSIYDPVVNTGYITYEGLDYKLGDFFDFDSNVPDGLNELATLFVINDTELFDEFIEEKKDQTVNSETAAVLVDLDTSQIAKVWYFPLADGKEYPPLLTGSNIYY